MQEYFWSLVIEENSIQAAIWTIENGSAKLVDISNPAAWEDEETLITAADGSLSSCIAKLPEDAPEPTKTVFGVPASWVTEGQIKKEHLDKIRVLCNKLSLSPSGFVVLPEAIAHYKKSEEKTPLSAILVGVYTQYVDISVFRLGNLVGTVNVARSLNLVDDIVEGFARFGEQEPFPSRFLLYDSKTHDLEDAKQDLIKADWDQVKFLHTPQVEILDPKVKMEAVSLAGAVEIGQVNNIDISPSPREEEVQQEAQEEVSNIEGVVDPTTLGFSLNSDMPEVKEAPKTKVHLPKINTGKFKFSIPKFGFNGILKNNFAFIGAVLLLIGIVVGFVAWWNLPKAQVIIIVSPKKIEGKQNITYDPKASSLDVSKKVVPAKLVETAVNGDKSKTTTGTKVIGTPAKGSVTFYNVSTAVTIPAGTVLTASSLNFIVDNDIQIASASGAASAASATGNITASGVGADYNLAGGTFFTVGNYSINTLQAKNDAALAGGSSQEVAATSKDDVNSLTTDLLKELTTTGKNNLKQNLDGGQMFLDNSVIATPSSKNIDHDVGTEATTVKLSLSAKVSGLTVLKSDMGELAKQLFSSQIPSGFSLKDDQIDYVINNKETDFMINLLPTIDTIKIAEQISGKDEATARRILSRLPGFQDVDVIMKPNIPILKFLPHVATNITVTLSAK